MKKFTEQVRLGARLGVGPRWQQERVKGVGCGRTPNKRGGEALLGVSRQHQPPSRAGPASTRASQTQCRERQPGRDGVAVPGARGASGARPAE